MFKKIAPLFCFFVMLFVVTLVSKTETTLIPEDILKLMTIEEKVGQMVQVKVLKNDISSLKFKKTPSKKTEDLIKNYHVGSVIFYRMDNIEEVINYNNSMQQWSVESGAHLPLLIASDFETGVGYNVLKGATLFPHQMGVAAAGDVDLAEKISGIIADEAKAIGVYWNYSPVADINTNINNPVIGVRAFGDTADVVTKYSLAYMKGYQKNGIMATAKHYPGHGDTNTDSHEDLPVVNYDVSTLKNVHFKPFELLINMGVKSIMTSHIILKEIDETLPATLSPKILTDMLRVQQGFRGIVVTDAMSMGGISNFFEIDEATVLAVQAGADIVMATGSYENQIRTVQSLIDAVKGGVISEKRLNISVIKILMEKSELGLSENPFISLMKAKELCGSEKHRRIAKQVAKKSMTLLLNNTILPIKKEMKVLVTGVLGIDEISMELKNIIDNVVSYKIKHSSVDDGFDISESDITSIINLAQRSDIVVITTYSSYKPPLSKEQIELVEEVKKLKKPVVIVSLGLPYDIKDLPDIDAFVATYALNRWAAPVSSVKGDISEVISEAIADVLTGKYNPTGKLPVSIPGTKYIKGYGLNY